MADKHPHPAVFSRHQTVCATCQQPIEYKRQQVGTILCSDCETLWEKQTLPNLIVKFATLGNAD